jgi:hypothetical protein
MSMNGHLGPAHAEQPPSIVDRLLHVDESEFKVELDPDPHSVAVVAVLASRPRPVCWTWKSSDSWRTWSLL